MSSDDSNDFDDYDYWWEKALKSWVKRGERHAVDGRYDPPYADGDPEDEAYYDAYKRGFDSKRAELSDKFEWA